VRVWGYSYNPSGATATTPLGLQLQPLSACMPAQAQGGVHPVRPPVCRWASVCRRAGPARMQAVTCCPLPARRLLSMRQVPAAHHGVGSVRAVRLRSLNHVSDFEFHPSCVLWPVEGGRGYNRRRSHKQQAASRPPQRSLWPSFVCGVHECCSRLHQEHCATTGCLQCKHRPVRLNASCLRAKIWQTGWPEIVAET
jgi:hypothetical protein